MLTTNFLASVGWPHLTENEALRKLVKALDPHYDLPSMGKVQRLLLPTLKNEIILSIKDRLYDWDIMDVNHERLQYAPDPERRKAATTFPVSVEQFQKGKGKGNGGATDSAGGGAAPTGPGGRTNLKPKEAAADANAKKAGEKLPPPEKVITPGSAQASSSSNFLAAAGEEQSEAQQREAER
uniref:Uncharacterized protein n=1 Tax=Chromera velia CCMP2878 TaxID=1169474 RepID=A0A0G4HVY7_9ALVE|eukprot:Cvel_8890.t1-p1 / transcript=Cvel_8890.t1 / gene=Cvel_8890 / organism=Chromera_velia_CCMP2878 / gene_product=hypothetical protein / transcript_product=hypothetical protein / location=Cvel_scaffold500:34893-38060(-) / protein_length=181 / sequence_SO=supercontig / SO=protein_coding / is_pseudo=false